MFSRRSIVFAVVAAAVVAAPSVTGSTRADAQQNRARAGDRTRIDTTFAFNTGGEVFLSLPAGDINVTTWARGEVRVIAVSERGDIGSSFSASRVRLEMRTRGQSTGATRYDVTVPAGTRVNASALGGRISVSGTRGEASLTTAGGAITASDLTGRSSIETMGGRVVLQRLDGATRVTAMNGNVTINEINGELDVDVVSGGVRVDRATLTQLRFESVAGQFDFSGTLAAQGRHVIETHTGGVILRFPADARASIDFSSFTGSLSAPDFPITLRPGSANDRGRDSQRQSYEINGGGARIAIETFSGGVQLRRQGAPDRR